MKANTRLMGFSCGLIFVAGSAAAQIAQNDTLAPMQDAVASDTAAPAPNAPADTTPADATVAKLTASPALPAPGTPSSLSPPAVAPNAELVVPLSPGVNNVPGFVGQSAVIQPSLNLSTEQQVTSQLAGRGYSDVTNLTMDANGAWHGTAVRNGVTVPVTVFANGTVVTQ